MFQRNAAGAKALARKAADLGPSYFFPVMIGGWADLGVGEFRTAIPALKQAKAMGAPPFVTAYLAFAHGAAGDRDGYRAIQERIFSAYVANVPMAVSHRARNDQEYRQAYVRYMAEAAVARAFDPAYQVLEAEMRQRVMGLRYTGNMLSPTVDPDSFWPMAGTLEKQIELSRAHYRAGGFADIDPDRNDADGGAKIGEL